jgi:hypothetical protein
MKLYLIDYKGIDSYKYRTRATRSRRVTALHYFITTCSAAAPGPVASSDSEEAGGDSDRMEFAPAQNWRVSPAPHNASNPDATPAPETNVYIKYLYFKHLTL